MEGIGGQTQNVQAVQLNYKPNRHSGRWSERQQKVYNVQKQEGVAGKTEADPTSAQRSTVVFGVDPHPDPGTTLENSATRNVRANATTKQEGPGRARGGQIAWQTRPETKHRKYSDAASRT